MALFKDVADPAERKQKLIDNALLVIEQIQGDMRPFMENNHLIEAFNRSQYLRAALKELKDL